jgi:integrase
LLAGARSSLLSIVKRRCQQVGLPSSIRNHSFRATGIPLHRENGGDIETAALLTGHADTRTTQLSSRSRPSLGGVDVESIRL